MKRTALIFISYSIVFLCSTAIAQNTDSYFDNNHNSIHNIQIPEIEYIPTAGNQRLIYNDGPRKHFASSDVKFPGASSSEKYPSISSGVKFPGISSGVKYPGASSGFHRSDLITPILLRDNSPASSSSSILIAVRERPGYALLSSAIIPGSAQAARGRWLRTGIYLAVEAATIYSFAEWRNRGQRGERNYENFADQNWSVVQYANWLIDYHDQHGISNSELQDLREMMDGTSATFNTGIDWDVVDLNVLRSVERNTPYIVTDDMGANIFSHTLPAYGSQQYYELISKYFQYAPGWLDYYSYNQQNNNDPFLIDRFGGKASPLFWDGKDRSELFNDQFRFSNNMLSLLILNHIISAFDGYFSVQLENRRIEATAGGTPQQQFRIIYRF